MRHRGQVDAPRAGDAAGQGVGDRPVEAFAGITGEDGRGCLDPSEPVGVESAEAGVDVGAAALRGKEGSGTFGEAIRLLRPATPRMNASAAASLPPVLKACSVAAATVANAVCVPSSASGPYGGS